MPPKQTITIIGATGNMGAAISTSLSKGNYRLLLCAHDLNKVQALVQDIQSGNAAADLEAMACAELAAWESDIIISAVPYGAEKEVAGKIKEKANQKIVISIANPFNSTYDGLVTAPETSAAEELQKLLPNSKVVKAFNTTFAADFLTPVMNDRQLEAFIAGNDEEALQTVSELVSTAGFNPIVAGNLPVSRTLEYMQLLRIRLSIKHQYN